MFNVSLLTACAHVYVDADGTQHVIGLVHASYRLPSPVSMQSQSLRVKAVGLMLNQSDVGSALALGYSDTALGFIGGNSCVRPDMLEAGRP